MGKNFCTICYADLGFNNPRQLCYKSYCPYNIHEIDDKDDNIKKNNYIHNNYIKYLKYYNRIHYRIILKLIYKYKTTKNINIIKTIKKYDKKIYKNSLLITHY